MEIDSLSSLERREILLTDIRNAIEVSWTRGNTDTFENFFGYSAVQGKSRPTNSEYISRIADRVRLEMKYKRIN